MRDFEQIIEELIKRQSVSFIGSVDECGFPNLKAMLPPRKRVGLKEFWFTTNTSSCRVTQYHINPKACVYFCDLQSFSGIQLIGTMEVLEDTLTKELIWREHDTMYYPRGITDPDYCVLKFSAHKGRYYEKFTSKEFPII
ncbi:MAG: pyridoxamine 5'-phosphate oxidase family protein [Nitrososphaerota archaeon]|jgi:general stress protein 26|nr:pyridoxamine 5'-phosphate oxidase family protein [Nitrososphaerota archaeon]